VGDGSQQISGLANLGSSLPGQLSHLSNPSYRHLLSDTQATAVIVKAQDAEDCPVAALIVDNPYLAFARVSQLFKPVEAPGQGVHPSAVVGDGCDIHESAYLGPNVVIGNHTRIGANVRIHANSGIGEHCYLGADVEIRANVTVYSRVRIGARSVLHSGVVIGADGFGFTPDATGQWQTIAQLGGVVIGKDVSIGANSCIDCGAIDDTIIGDGVKIDNLVQIGHNCIIGAHTLICGMVGIAGSSKIGKHCVLAGRAGVGGDQPVEICDGVVVSSCTVISQSVDKPGVYSGSVLFNEHNKWRRNALRLGHLDDMFKRVKRLEKHQQE